MAMQWSITILDLGNGQIAFLPAVPGAEQNQPLGVNVNDLVTWNNTTNNTLTLQSNPAGIYLADPIPPGQVSDPIFRVTASVTYACTNPTTPQHSIQIWTPPPPATS
jgi:hypothetical protein